MNTNLNSSLRNNPAPAFKIEEGYTVRDAAGNDIGTVLTFRFSDDDPRTSVAETATPSTPDSGRPVSILESVVDVFADDIDMPEELRESLLQHGFIRIRQGMLAPDLFATMDQVARVSDDVVYLNVYKDGLVAR
jgi:hypothetical protein